MRLALGIPGAFRFIFGEKSQPPDVFAPSTSANSSDFESSLISAKFACLDFSTFVCRKPPFFTPPVLASRRICFEHFLVAMFAARLLSIV